MGLLRVALVTMTVLFSLWVFVMAGAPVLGDLSDFAKDDPAVQETNRGDTVTRITDVAVVHAPTILGGGFVLLFFGYIVFRERGTRRRPP